MTIESIKAIIGDYVDLTDPRYAQMMRLVSAALSHPVEQDTPAPVSHLMWAAKRVISVYAGMQDGNGEPCPDIAALRDAVESIAPGAHARGDDLLPIWLEGGLGDRLLEAMHAYREGYVYSPDEGWDHEPTEFERLLLEDFLNGALSTDKVNAILQEAARAALPRAPAAVPAALEKPSEPSKEQIERGIEAYREGVYLTDEQVYASVSSIVRAALAAEGQSNG